jgi:hypothetical protein
MFSVSDSITNYIFQKYLEYSTSLFIDQTRDTLDSSSARQSSDGGLGDTLDVITQYLTMALGTTLSQSLSSFSSSFSVAEHFSLSFSKKKKIHSFFMKR